jgi:hypothetical protein
MPTLFLPITSKQALKSSATSWVFITAVDDIQQLSIPAIWRISGKKCHSHRF